ncbi:MAG: alpha/beta hydrolase [Campylobacteraceae bacterium]|jgi:pimeloyl-ACP methyl ester carboxylesterase|nr:alpha/beta hydrolase [Campylobacteraceae bacterium]
MAIKRVEYNGAELSLSYLLLNQDKEESILFLHGWGANKELMKNSFGDFFKDYRHIYLDLPGFGNSSINAALDSYEVKAVVEKFLRALNQTPQIIIGHSFGGKIALLLNPENIVLLSSSGIILPKRLWVKIKIRLFKIAKIFGLKGLYKVFASKDVKGMDMVMYEMFKKVVDEDMSEVFKAYEGRAVLFWGEDDDVTPLVAAFKIRDFMKNSTLHMLKGGHFFFADKGKIIEERLKETLKDKK